MSSTAHFSLLTAMLPPAVRAALADQKRSDPATLAELGLSSMQVVELATAIEQQFDIEFEPEEFLGFPRYSLEALASVIEAKTAGQV